MVTIYLKTPLFTFNRTPDNHVPRGTSAVRGELREREHGGMTIRVHTYLDGTGKTLDNVPRTLFLPIAKIDHVLLEERS